VSSAAASPPSLAVKLSAPSHGSSASGDEAEVRRKFQSKTTEQILSPYGFDAIKQGLADIEAAFVGPCLNTLLRGQEKQQFEQACGPLLKLAEKSYKSSVKLDIKAKNGKVILRRSTGS